MSLVVGYARVSSEDQSLDVQIEQLTQAGAERVFSEKRSGKSREGREELERALEFVRDSDVLIVTRLDRLARSILDLRTIVDRMAVKGVGFRCIQQGGIDTTTSGGKLMLNILASFAEFELDIRRERQAEGIVRGKANGVYRGRPATYDPDMIRQMRMNGMGATQIARALGCSRKTVYAHTPGLWPQTPVQTYGA